MLFHMHFLVLQCQIFQLMNQSRSHSNQPDYTQSSFVLGYHQYFITVLDAVGVESPGVVLQLLRAEGAALVNIVEPHAVGGQLHHCCQLLLQLSNCLVQTDVQLT